MDLHCGSYNRGSRAAAGETQFCFRHSIMKVMFAFQWFPQGRCLDSSVSLFLTACVCFPSGAAPDFPLAGGERVWQPGRRHRRLEPATPALAEQRVQHRDGVSEPQVAPVQLHLSNSAKCAVKNHTDRWSFFVSCCFQWTDDEARV